MDQRGPPHKITEPSQLSHIAERVSQGGRPNEASLSSYNC
jgi:hypothetical protein